MSAYGYLQTHLAVGLAFVELVLELRDCEGLELEGLGDVLGNVHVWVGPSLGDGLRARGLLSGVWRRSGLVAQKLRTYYSLTMSQRVRSIWHLRTVGVMSGLLLRRRHGHPVHKLMAAARGWGGKRRDDYYTDIIE